MHNLSIRLETILRSVPLGSAVADVGTDHAFLPIALINSKVAQKVVATDVNVKPLENAKKNIEKAHLEKEIELRLSDGLQNVKPNEVDVVIIAGMGGDLIARIIEAAPWLKQKDKTLILQPMSSPDSIREYLYTSGFSINKERAIIDDGRIYSVLTVTYSGKAIGCEGYKINIGELEHDMSEAATEYIINQAKRLRKLAESVKTVERKRKLYLTTIKALDKIEKILEKRSN